MWNNKNEGDGQQLKYMKLNSDVWEHQEKLLYSSSGDQFQNL